MIEGIYLPIITPFLNEEVDFKSYELLINHYIVKGISGLIPLGTTGEVPTINDYEFEKIIDKTIEYTNNRVPIYVGVGGNNTKKVIEKLNIVEKYNIEGILSVSPYYNRPSQEGIYSHFSAISKSTDMDIILYNIPYRTGRAIENDTIRKLAEFKNIVALKDASGDIKQTMELLLNPPKDFSVLTGEDMLFFTTLTHGGQGGILASAHIQTESFIKIYNDIKANDHVSAFNTWKKISQYIPLLFKEPNPAPLKYYLNKVGLIDSPEVRLPLTEISNELAAQIDKAF